MRASIVVLLLLSAAAGCGSQASGTAEEHAQPPAASQGEETSPEEPVTPDPVEESEPEPEPARASGPGTVTLTARVDESTVPATVRILDEAGEVTREAASGEPISLPAGDYRVEISITDPKALADKPTQARQLLVQPGENPPIEARFRWAKVTLNVLVGGRAQPGAKVTLLRDGEPVAEMKSGAPPAAITPGRYEADVQLKGSIIRVKGLQFPEGATQTVPVRVQY
jgi:hypothetical protein